VAERSVRERLGLLLARAIPVGIVLGLGWELLLGNQSLFRHLELREEAARTAAAWGRESRENMEAHRRLTHLADDPINLERLAADEAGHARPGSVIYRFDEAADAEHAAAVEVPSPPQELGDDAGVAASDAPAGAPAGLAPGGAAARP
jgi:hypothetical protein